MSSGTGDDQFAIRKFDWDQGNLTKCRLRGIEPTDVEEMFIRGAYVREDRLHSDLEERFQALGRSANGRYMLVAFTLRELSGGSYIRPISCRYMHRKEVRRYAEAFPDLQDR